MNGTLRFGRRGVAALLVPAAIVFAGGSALAYWLTSGTGTGTAQARTFTAPTVTGGTVTGNLLYPGLTANGTNAGGDLVVVGTNPNPFPVTVTVTIGGTVTGCTTPGVSLLAGTSFTLTANQTSATKTMPFRVSMGTNSSSDCQGATLSIPLSTSSTTN